MNRYCFLITFLVYLVVLFLLWHWGLIKSLKNFSVSHSSAFIPTNEWQREETDQEIPHISHEADVTKEKLQTSEDENKKLDEEMTLQLLDENVKKDDFSHDNEKYTMLRESSKNIRDKIRAIEQEEDDLISLLDDLEHKLHALNTAKEFIRINGISDVIVPCLNANSTRVRSAAARALGAAVSNIETGQIAAFKAGVMTSLLRNIALEKEYEIRSCSLYALSCLVYGYPTAEVKLVEEGGLSILLSLFDEDDSADALKLQLRVITFISELFLEREDAKLTVETGRVTENMKTMTEKLRQYDSVGLNFKLVERGWCSKLRQLLVNKIFKKQSSGFNEEDIDYDVADKVLIAIAAVSPQCETQFKNDESFRAVLKNLRFRYKLLLHNHDDAVFRDRYILVKELYIKFAI